MHVCIHGDQAAKIITKRGLLGAANVSLLSMSSDSTDTVGTAIILKIRMEDTAHLKPQLHVHNVSGRNPDQDLFRVRAALILLYHTKLP